MRSLNRRRILRSIVGGKRNLKEFNRDPSPTLAERM